MTSQDWWTTMLQRQKLQRKPQRRNHQRNAKTVKLNGYDFDALIDTGSTITLIRESVYQILRKPTLNPTKIKLTSFGKSEIKPFGSFKFTNIEGNKFMADIYVIDNLQTTIDVIIGTDVLKQTEFKISANGIELILKKKDHFINLINVSKAHNQSEIKENALEVLQLKLKNAEDKCKNLEMHVRTTSTLSLEKAALLEKLHKLEESNLEKVEKLVKLEEKYEILQETFKITQKRLVEKEIECDSFTEKILILNALTESNDHRKTSMSTKEREIKPSKRKTKKLKSSRRNDTVTIKRTQFGTGLNYDPSLVNMKDLIIHPKLWTSRRSGQPLIPDDFTAAV
ncbi:uncharacterized protein TNCV_2732991 [Trichonephila clavipes]|nr:uncharacterized protein TNCV_2732991 [Trichonephila clavipes]